MPGEGVNEHNEARGDRFIDPEKTNASLDRFRNLTRSRMLAMLAALGISLSGCEFDDKKNTDNPTLPETVEGYEECAPFLRCAAAPRLDNGYTIVLEVPEGETFKDTVIQILGGNGEVIYEGTRTFPPGDSVINFTEENVPGVSQAKKHVYIVKYNGQEYQIEIDVDFEGMNEMFE